MSLELSELCIKLKSRTTRLIDFIRDDMKKNVVSELKEVRAILDDLELYIVEEKREEKRDEKS